MRRLLASTLGLAATLSLAACGGGESAKLLPGVTARQITENLASVRTLVAEGECIAAQDQAQQIGNQVDDLQGIDQKLKEALQRGAERLNEVVLTCEEAEEETEETVPTETVPSKAEREKQEKEQKAQEKKEEEEAKKPPPPPKPEQEPPKGEAKGHEEAPPEAESEAPSGGIGPGGEAGGD